MTKPRSLKILYVSPYFAPAWSYGGPVRVSYDFAKELAKLGHQVTVATTDVMDGEHRINKRSETLDKIRILRFKNISNRLAKKLNLYSPIGLKKWLNRNIDSFDVVHVHEFFTMQSLYAAKLCQKHNKPFFIQPHGSLQIWATKSRFAAIKKSMIDSYNKYLPSCQGIIVLTKKEASDVERVYPQYKSQISIIENGLDVTALRKIKKINIRKKFKLKRDTKIIAFLGRIIYQKGLDIALQALALLDSKIDFRLLIIGPDEGEKKNLLALAKELRIDKKIIYTGMLQGSKKLELLKSADISLLLSRSEGLPTSLLESAALGMPIVSSQTSNFSQAEKFKAGYEVKSEKEAAEKLELILSDSALAKELGKNSLKLAREFDIRKQTNLLLKLYECR